MKCLGLGFVLFIASTLDTTYGLESDLKYVLTLYASEKEEWTEAHNYYRRQVSDPEAANMRLMTWDDELEALAVSVVKTCDFGHSSSSKLQTSVFPQAGENLYTGGNYRFSEMFKRSGVTKLWYDEVQYYDYTTRGCEAGQLCGHYTQVVWANTYKVGCAIGRCTAVEGGHPPFLISCNYGPAGNEYAYGVARSPYTNGEACSQCGEGDLCIDQLCNNTARDIPFTTTTKAPDTTTVTTTEEPITTVVSTKTESETTVEPTKTESATTVLIPSTEPVTVSETTTTECDRWNLNCGNGDTRTATMTYWTLHLLALITWRMLLAR